MYFPKLTNAPLLCLKKKKAFQLFKSYLSWSQGSVKSKPCRLSRRCPAVHAKPRPSSALRVSPLHLLTDVELVGPLFFFFFFFSLYEPQHALPTWMKFRRWEQWDLTAEGTRWWQRAEGRAVRFSALGWMKRWMGGRMGGMCRLLPLFRRSSALEAAKSFLRRMLCSKWVPPLSVSVVHLGFRSLNPPFSPRHFFVIPSLFLTVDALDVLMLFILKWQSILHCCCCYFFYEYIHTGKRYFFCLCTSSYVWLSFLWISLLMIINITIIIMISWFWLQFNWALFRTCP